MQLVQLILGLMMFTIVISGCGQQSSTHTVSSFKQRELERSVFFAESNLDSLGDAGYVRWTPTNAAIQLVQTMNAAQTLTPEEKKQYRQQGMFIPKPIPYVLNQPTDSWQIVIVADEVGQKILIKGYGNDLTQPLIIREIPCCQF